ncbi:Lrp/AsnC family transcriptional regulator [Variovorax sp. J22R133]|uniref:Lrp/AsnC family transcriptional regulator n=1 Tax=Variovorax brevis TaxID=3053503 RepID=UPI002575E853|nr:Lrp/AsnC family transcriptional regulator [Variovorax sp. J22R133]MDM0111317.1 Lrp/AsnC family transcriptional regulator [Variovorax sp. J22R133]
MNVGSVSLDEHCLKILSALQRDGRQTVQQISEAVGLSPTPCWKRIKEMEASGVIRGYTTIVDPELVGLHVSAVAEVNLDRHSESLVQRFEEAVAASPHIVRCVSATGPADYILNVTVPDMKQYERFLHEVLFSLPGVTHVRSSIVLREVKSEVALPLGHLMTGGAAAPRRR